MILIKNITIYSPSPLGKKDILISGGRIVHIEENISIPKKNFPEHYVINGENLIALPGIIDLHIHIAGAGGEGGFSSRTPEMSFNNLILNGITTCVGLLGTDGITRSIENLLAKAASLEEKGLSTYIWTGSYQFPTKTLTGDIKKDIIFVDKIIGIGEIAISDHRSSNPSYNDLVTLASEARIAGLISGKCGITHFHLGDGKKMIESIDKIIEHSDIPYENILPTHINRNTPLFKKCIEYCKSGGYVDITTGIRPEKADVFDVVDPVDAYITLINSGCNIENITMSSDSGGSMPIFNESGELETISIGLPSSNLDVFRDLLKTGMGISEAIMPLTSTPAKLLKFNTKGVISNGFSADIMLLDKEYNLHSLLSNGNILVENYKPIKKDYFL